MSNQPLLVSIVIGIIVIFVIVGASLAVKLSDVNKMYSRESLKSMQLGKDVEELKSQINILTEQSNQLEAEKGSLSKIIEKLELEKTDANKEIEKLNKIKDE